MTELKAEFHWAGYVLWAIAIILFAVTMERIDRYAKRRQERRQREDEARSLALQAKQFRYKAGL